MAREGRKVVQVITGADILKHVEPNDFVISMRNFQGGIEWSKGRGAVSSAYVVLAPSERVDYSYFSYLLKCKQYIQALQSTSNLVRDGQALRYENFSLVDLPVVPLHEQRVIAAFLDRETQRIKLLISRKERLIELLDAKQTALITRAVTKGLNASVALKDSGVEWFGKIPAHWGLERLKHCAEKIGSGKTPRGGAEVYTTDGVMLIRSQNVQFAGLRLDDVVFIDKQTDREMASTRVHDGDVLLNITGASLGRCCVARLGDATANVSQHVCIVRPRLGMFHPLFMANALACDPAQAQIFGNEAGISRDALNFEQIGNLVVCRPPLDEQSAIASFLDSETGRIATLIAEVREGIERLDEYCAALIFAAVTGKIDVREEVA